MTDAGDIRLLFQQVGGAIAAIEALRSLMIDLRNQSQGEHTATRDSIEQIRVRAEALARRLDALELAAVQLAALKKPVEELITLRHRVLGGLFVLGALGSMIYSFAHGAGASVARFFSWLEGG
jgi:hypothetical protein